MNQIVGDTGRCTGVPRVPPSAMTHVADTVPYPWPFDGRFDPSSFALVVFGDQPGITSYCVDTESVRATLAGLADSTRLAGGTVVHVRHRHAGPADAVPLDDVSIDDDRADRGDVVIEAIGWDALYGTPLESELRRRRITTLALGGFGSEVTVDSTVRTLNDRGWECLVVTDGCAPFDPELGRRAHASLTMSGGIFGALGTAAALTATLTRSTEATP